MEKGIEELLKPRYKVIADYPGSNFEVGGIIEMIAFNVDVFKDYPHLFKRLEWWEDRKPEEMPEYVKYVGEVSRIMKVIKWHVDKEGDFFEGNDVWFEATGNKNGYSVVYGQPATEQEYLNSLPNKQNK